MGHSRASKQQNHEQIVSVAAKLFRESGIDGISIADLMKAAGLTHGGFYKHFDSRDDLVAEAFDHALDKSNQRYREMQDLTLASLIDNYLSIRHRDAVGDGCALAALTNDVARARQDTQELYANSIERTLAMMTRLSGSEGPAARRAAIARFSAMVGALNMARAIKETNPELSEEILETARNCLLDDMTA